MKCILKLILLPLGGIGINCVHPKKKIPGNHKTLHKLSLLGFVFYSAYKSTLLTLLKTQNPQLSLRVSFAEKEGFEPPEV